MFQITPFGISGALIIITYLPFVIFLTFSGKTKVARLFLYHSICVLLWGGTAFLLGSIQDASLSLFLWTISYIPVIFIPIFFAHTVFILTNNKNTRFIFLIYFQGIIFNILALKGLVFTSVSFKFNSFYYCNASYIGFCEFIIWVLIISCSHFEIVNFYKNSYGHQKKQIFFLLLSTPLGFLGGSTNFLPTFGVNVYPFGNFLIPIYSVVAAYAILKHQMLNIEIVIKKSIVYSLLIALISILYLILVLLCERSLQGIVGYKSTVFSITAAFIIGIIFTPLKDKIQKTIDRLFFIKSPTEISEENELLWKEINRSEKLKMAATLTSGMAHEIRNPLTVLKTFNTYLPQKLNDKEFLKKYANIVDSEVNRIERLVQDLLEFAKPAPLNLKPTDIHELLKNSIKLIETKSAKANIKIVNDFDKKSPMLLIDANQIKQVFLNLFLNAIDAMPGGGILKIKTYHNKNKEIFEIKITDTGCGNNQADLPHIFEPFFTKKESGTGLGLSITKGIIDEHMGSIKATSPPKEGTTFWIGLPNNA